MCSGPVKFAFRSSHEFKIIWLIIIILYEFYLKSF